MKSQLVCAAGSIAAALGLARASRIVCALLVVAPPLAMAAQSTDKHFADADKAAQENRLGDMQASYERILEDDPDNVRALEGLGAALAWQERYGVAQQSYQRALAIAPDNVEARVGLGYAYAWNGEYANAHNEFNRVLASNPNHVAARKGIAYSYLWAGQYGFALESLDIATSIAPNDAEIWEARGKAHLLNGRNREAIANFEQSLSIQPDRVSAQTSRLDAYRSAPALEINAVAGSTSGAESGLRRIEVAHWAGRSTRLALRYDNSLGLDAPAIANRDQDAHSYFAAVSHRFHNDITVVAEGGRRTLADGDQNIAMLQGVVELSRGALRMGAQVGDHELGHTDTLFFSGFRFPVADSWQFEPIVYSSESGAAGDSEWRAVLNAEHRLGPRLSTGALAGFGGIDSDVADFDGDTQLFGGWLHYEIDGRYAISLMLRREMTPARNFTIGELGFTVRFPGN